MNKSSVLSRVLAIAATAAISGIAHADEPNDYLLLCKGGNNSFEMHSKMHSIGDSARVTATYVTVNFRRSTNKAPDGLRAGYCAWADRGVHADEPNEIRALFVGTWVVVNARTSGDIHAKVPLGGQRPPVTYDVKGTRVAAGELSALLRALQEGADFQMHVHNNGEGALVMSRFGP